MKKLLACMLVMSVVGSGAGISSQAAQTEECLHDSFCCYLEDIPQAYAATAEEVDLETGFRPDRVYYIRNVRSGYYLDAQGAATGDGVSIIQCQYLEQQNQQWHVYKASDGYYRISPLHAHEKTLSLPTNPTANNSYVKLWSKGQRNDEWAIVKNTNRNDRSYHIVSKASGSTKALAVQNASTSENAKLLQADYTNDSIRNDEWVFEPVMETEVYYDTGYLERENVTDAEVQAQFSALFKEVTDCFYQKFGIRYQTPKYYRNTSVADACGTEWDEACPHGEDHKYAGKQLPKLRENLSGHTFRIQLTGHIKREDKELNTVRDFYGGTAYMSFPTIAISSKNCSPNLLAHEMTHTFDIDHHDGEGGPGLMNKQGYTDSQIWGWRPELWDYLCEETIIKNSARFSTYQDTTYPQSNTLTVDRNTMDYMVLDIPRKTTVAALRGMINFGTGSFTVYNAQGTALAATAQVATGCTVNADGYTYSLVVKGDINGDGSVTIEDTMALSRIIARQNGGISPTYKETKLADLNEDGRVNIQDTMLLSKMIAQDAAG